MNRQIKRVAITATATAVAAVPFVAAPQANSAVLHGYTISQSSATYQQVGAHNLLPSGADDQVVTVALPFTVRLYGASFAFAHVSSNGNIQFTGGTPSAAYANSCLPTSDLSGVVVAPYWDDLVIRPNSSTVPDGVFTKTSGTAPHRKWAVNWRGVDYATGNTAVRVEAIFTEGSQNVVTIYGDGNGSSATIGVQKNPAGPATQFACNSGRLNTILPGEKLTYVYH